VQLLVAFGNVIGRVPYFQVEADRHYTNLFVILVGETAKARKGVSFNQALRVFRLGDPGWSSECVKSGLSSGEGLILAVSGPDEAMANVRLAIQSKRLLVFEPEFALVLRVQGREGDTLSAILRQAWDGGELRVLTKNSPLKATGAHISIIAHITQADLTRYLNSTEMANGYANRFMFFSIHRSKELPDGGHLNDEMFAPLVERLQAAVKFARSVDRMQWEPEARQLWHAVYSKLSEGRPGETGAVTARAEAQVLRLACLYALLDKSAVVCLLHLRAALALWRFAEASAEYIFGDSTGDKIADVLFRELRSRGASGMTRTEIRNYFSRHKTEREIELSLSLLEARRLVVRIVEETGGRPATRWLATEATEGSVAPDSTDDGGRV
jgi:hypothetical protein